MNSKAGLGLTVCEDHSEQGKTGGGGDNGGKKSEKTQYFCVWYKMCLFFYI